MSRTFLILVGFLPILAGCSRRPVSPPEVALDEVAARIEAYRIAALRPARVAPPAIAFEPHELEAGRVRAITEPLRPEDADWNRWPEGGPRLFNNRAALLFRVRIEAPGPTVWLPEQTFLELNDPETVVPAAETTEALLGDLLYWAFMEERWLAGGDLVDRARGAGPFRAAYLPLHAEDGVLEGVVAFPLVVGPEASLADLHVVAVRLTVGILSDDGEQQLVWTID